MRCSPRPPSCASPILTASPESVLTTPTPLACGTTHPSKRCAPCCQGFWNVTQPTVTARMLWCPRTTPRPFRPPSGRRSIPRCGTWHLDARVCHCANCWPAGRHPQRCRAMPRCRCSTTRTPTVLLVAGFVESGYTAAKLHAWGIPDRDASLLRLLRADFPDLVLMFDAEGRYSVDGARLVAAACVDVGARWFVGSAHGLRRARIRGAAH